MIVYGDHTTIEEGRAKIAAIDDWLRQASVLGPGLERHGLLVAALIEAGTLAQGLADVRFAERGEDEPDRLDRALMGLVTRLAAAVGRSWDSAFNTFGPIPTPANLAELGVPHAALTIRQPEGFAHYALYPESTWTSAKAFGRYPDAGVIGIRSIGTTLAAMVAAAWEACPPVTVRPTGHPFARHLAIGAALDVAWRASADARHAIVDEGPGLSGSSFGAVADALVARGASERSMVLFPSHAGDLGQKASEQHRARWSRISRPVTTLDDLAGLAGRPEHRITAWADDLVGPATAPPQDLSGGRWRGVLLPPRHPWPPADAQNEARKFLLSTARGRVLLRFVGLGGIGLRKLALAQRLATAGFGIAPFGWRHGFLVEPWRDDCLPLTSTSPARDRIASVLANYLAFRAEAFPMPDESGAELPVLLDMARINTGEALGAEAAGALDGWSGTLTRLAPRLKRVAVDARLQPWEWLETSDGRLLKTDALDHHASHDLIGCQPIEWDIAGAAAEWGLSDGERHYLVQQLDLRGLLADPALLRFFGLAYPAFQVGLAAMALGRAEPDERSRLVAREADCRDMLRAALRRNG